MSEKSYVTMEQQVCPVCGVTHDTGALLLDCRLYKTFDLHTTTGYGLCAKCKQLHEDGFVALVECTGGRDGMKVHEGNRTGTIAHLKRSVLSQVFNMPIDPKLPMIFVDVGVIAKIQAMEEKS
jgi:hypothetical protein